VCVCVCVCRYERDVRHACFLVEECLLPQCVDVGQELCVPLGEEGGEVCVRVCVCVGEEGVVDEGDGGGGAFNVH
jgi:hypothetical protein